MYFPLGFVVFILSQSFLLSSRFANAFRQVYDLTHNLEKKVEDRTRTLEEATQTLLLANHGIADSREQAEKALQKSKNLNDMMEVIIQSKSTDEIFERIFDLFSEKYELTSYLVYILDKEDGFIKLYKHYGDKVDDENYLKLLYKNQFSIDDAYCTTVKCIQENKSFFTKRVQIPHPCKLEEENIIEGEIDSFYIVRFFPKGSIGFF